MQGQNGTDPGMKTKPILLVEDDCGLCEYVVQLLEHTGYQVIAVGCAEDALIVFDKQPGGIALVFTDINLPGQSGLDLIDHLQKTNPGIPLLVGSGQHVFREIVEMKGVPFIPKPYDNRILLAHIRQLWGQLTPEPPEAEVTSSIL
jgi:DNA-binding NtrC family response regulator